MLTITEMLEKRIKPRSVPFRTATFKYAQEKIDGWRLTFVRGEDQNAQAWTRSTDVTDAIMQSWFLPLLATLPVGSMLDCELTVPGQHASAVSSLLAGNGDLLTARGCNLTCFFIPYWNGESCEKDRFKDQASRFRDFVRDCGLGAFHKKGIRFAKVYSAMVDGRPMRDSELFELLYDVKHRRPKGEIEGFVLKDTPFTGWLKFKPSQTIDLVCTGFEEGDEAGKYVGQCGALIGSIVIEHGTFDCSNNECVVPPVYKDIAHVSGMSDAVREAIGPKDVGRVFECEYQLVAANGRLRHPRFIRWRDDKPASQCDGRELVE